MTFDQVAAKKAKAARFVRDVLEDDDRADEIESEDVEDFAARKKLTITNSGRRTTEMANGNGNGDNLTKSDLQDMCDQVQTILKDAYQPESSREDLASAVGDALDILQNGPSDEDGDDGSDDDDGAGN